MLTVPLIAWLVAKGRKRERKRLASNQVTPFFYYANFWQIVLFPKKTRKIFFSFLPFQELALHGGRGMGQND